MKISLRNIVRNDLRIAIVSALAWGVIAPVSTQLRGMLTVEVIGMVLILTTLSMELIKALSKSTTFKSSTMIVIAYDVFFILATTVGMIMLEGMNFALLFIGILIPYALLGKNAGNKFKVLIGETYSSRVTEKIYTSLTLLGSRSVLMSVSAVSMASSVGASNDEITYTFLLICVFLLIFSIWNYKTNYKYLK